MNKRFVRFSFGLPTGMLLGFLVVGGISSAVAEFMPPPDTNGTMYLANHHKEIKFSLPPNGSRSIPLPKRDCPILFTFVVGNIVSAGEQQPPVCFQIQNAVTAPPSGVGFLGSACRKGLDVIMSANPDGSITIQTTTATTCFPGTPLDSDHLNVCVSMWY